MKKELFDLTGKVAIVTGGNGVLGGAMAQALASYGAHIIILGRNLQTVESRTRELAQSGYTVRGHAADVLNKQSLLKIKQEILSDEGRIDILVNAAGGNISRAIVQPEGSFFELDMDAHRDVIDLNLNGTLLPCQVFGEVMASQESGSIINISSATVQNTVTRLLSYSAAKSAVENFTRWLAVEVATKYGDGIRVNAIVPGFFIGEQNKQLLMDPSNNLTDRGKKIISNTPMGRFGEPEELGGAVVFLASNASSFVNASTVIVDGGFTAFSGV